MLPVEIIGEKEGYKASVTKRGELIVSSLAKSEPYAVELGVDLQVYNVVPAISGKIFVMTGMTVGADRNVSTDTSVVIYEALNAETSTITKLIWRGDINKGQMATPPMDNVATQSTRYINAYCDDDDVDLTIFGYYANA